MKFGKMFKKTVTGQESAKDAFSDFEKLNAMIEPVRALPRTLRNTPRSALAR